MHLRGNFLREPNPHLRKVTEGSKNFMGKSGWLGRRALIEFELSTSRLPALRVAFSIRR